MTIKKEIALTSFEFLSGAKDWADVLTYEPLEALEAIIEDAYMDGSGAIDETTLNDIFWFEEDWIADMLGFDSWEALEAHNAAAAAA